MRLKYKNAFYNNELVAHYVTIPVVYKFNDKTLNGLLSLNTATKAEHQGKGLFTKLASFFEVYAVCPVDENEPLFQ